MFSIKVKRFTNLTIILIISFFSLTCKGKQNPNEKYWQLFDANRLCIIKITLKHKREKEVLIEMGRAVALFDNYNKTDFPLFFKELLEGTSCNVNEKEIYDDLLFNEVIEYKDINQEYKKNGIKGILIKYFDNLNTLCYVSKDFSNRYAYIAKILYSKKIRMIMHNTHKSFCIHKSEKKRLKKLLKK